MSCKREQCEHVFLDDVGELACGHYPLCVDDELFECEAEEKDKMTVDQSIYRKNIIEKMDRQIQKGIDKYGTTLEQNDWLKTIDRIVYLQEELIDALVYSEHIISKLKELNVDLD